ATDPEPDVPASRASAVSTSITESVGSVAAIPSRPAIVAHPTPIRPCRGVPVRKPIAGRTSAGSISRSSVRKVVTLAGPRLVPAAASDAATTAANRVIGPIQWYGGRGRIVGAAEREGSNRAVEHGIELFGRLQGVGPENRRPRKGRPRHRVGGR